MKKILSLSGASGAKKEMRVLANMVKKCDPKALEVMVNQRARLDRIAATTTNLFLDEEITIKQANEAHSFYFDRVAELQELANTFKTKCVCKPK